LFVLLLVILFIFPATAIRYAQAGTENSQESSDSGNGQDNSSSSTGSEQQQSSNSTGNEQQQSSNSTGNGQESGNTGNEQQQSSNSTGNAQEMPGATSPSGSTANTTTSTGGPAANTTTSTGGPAANATSPIWSAAYNATLFGFRNSTGNMSSADFVKAILALHNRERAAVGVPPLMWSDKIAADARPWAEHVVTIGHMVHDSEHLGPLGEGENIAGYSPPNGPLALGGGVNLWLDEKKDYHGGLCCPGPGEPVTGHYTQMVWRDTKEVGCATAYGRGIPYSKEGLGHVASKPNDFMSILVCRYSPPGNYIGQKAY
jgi:uncharacterized protein YkwD